MQFIACCEWCITKYYYAMGVYLVVAPTLALGQNDLPHSFQVPFPSHNPFFSSVSNLFPIVKKQKQKIITWTSVLGGTE